MSGRLRLKYWGQRPNDNEKQNMDQGGNEITDTDNPKADILLVRDDTPSLYYDEDELRVQRIVEMATQKILSEKVRDPFRCFFADRRSSGQKDYSTGRRRQNIQD